MVLFFWLRALVGHLGRRWIAFDLLLFLQATSSVQIGTLESHAGRSWYPHCAESQRAMIPNLEQVCS